MYEEQLNTARPVITYLLIAANGVLGVSVLFGVRLPWIVSHPGNLVTVITVLLFASIFCFRKPVTHSQKVIFTVVLAFYLLLLLVFPYTFEISNDSLPSKGYRGPVVALCFGVLTFGYHVLSRHQLPILVLMGNGAIAIFFTEWWFSPDRFIRDFRMLVLFTIVSISLGGAIAWLLIRLRTRKETRKDIGNRS